MISELADLIETAGDELALHETTLDEARDILNDNDDEAADDNDEDVVEAVIDRLREALFDVQRAADEVQTLLCSEEHGELGDLRY